MLEFDVTQDEYVAFNLEVWRTSPVMRRQVLWARVAAAAAVMVIVLIGWDGDLVPQVVAGLAAAGVVWWASPAVLRWTVKRSVLRVVAHGGMPTGRAVVWLDGVGIHEDLAGQRVSTSWPVIGPVVETASHVFVHTAPMAAIAIPRRGQEPQVQAFAAQLQAGLARRIPHRA